MKFKVVVLVFLLTILVSTSLANPELFEYFIENTNAAEHYDIDKAITFALKESPVRHAISDWRNNAAEKNAKIVRESLIDVYLTQLVDSYGGYEEYDEKESMFPPVIDGKVVYLTFDDGPSPTITRKILGVLDDYKIKATFFSVGSMADKFPDILKEVYDRGHTIGNHTYSHVYGQIYRSSADFIFDMKRAEDAFKNILGEDFETRIIRFPGGTHAGYKQPIVRAVEAEGYKWFDWNTVNGDSELKNPSNEYLMTRFLNTYGKRDTIIILMHDTEGKQSTVDTLPMMIEHLKLEGYSFSTLDDYNH